jgi:hypothetical protein
MNGLQTLILRCKHRREDEKIRKDSLSFNTNITVTGQECHVADLQTQYEQYHAANGKFRFRLLVRRDRDRFHVRVRRVSIAAPNSLRKLCAIGVDTNVC